MYLYIYLSVYPSIYPFVVDRIIFMDFTERSDTNHTLRWTEENRIEVEQWVV